MNPQKKMVYIQRIFNPSQYRSGNLTTLDKENFDRIMIESMHKAINSDEDAVKEKHVRKLLIGSYQAESGSFFWQYLPVLRLKEDQIVCWKFCQVLHKMLRDGHKSILASSYERRQILLDCGNMWRHVAGHGYAQLIFKYCTLLYNRINFLVRIPRFPNDLRLSDEQLEEIGQNDSGVFFDFSCEIFDLLDDVLRLQEFIMQTLSMKNLPSTHRLAKCYLSPIVACIHDSNLLYDYSVKILFKLHSRLTASTLEGHRNRFFIQHRLLRQFYNRASHLQYFKTLIQFPHLEERPPDFLVASKLQKHVTPEVLMIEESTERDSPDFSTNHFREVSSSQLLVNFNDDCASFHEDTESNTSSTSSNTINTNGNSVIDTVQNSLFEQHAEMLSASIPPLQKRNKDLIAQNEKLESENIKLKVQLDYNNLEENEKFSTLQALHDSKVKEHEAEVKKLKDEIVGLKYQMHSSKSALESLKEECKRAQHDNDISQEAMKKLVRDLSDMKAENAILKSNQQITVPNAPVQKADLAANENLVEELRKKIGELTMQLNQRESQCNEWVKEKELLMMSKSRLEQQLDNHHEDLLMAEMNETDKIIKEATRRIEELSENSRKQETGIKLQVNEKISEVCSNLMKAVRNLIIQSRLLQKEVVGSDVGSSAAKVEEFYKRNSSWTEGLISAANVVAMAARSLVDSADRTMSGQTRFSELAAAAHEIAAATTQLVVASRVKANKDSEKLKILTTAAKQVNQCTSNVVDTARVCGELIEQEVDKIDISSLSLHQTKKLEMETQVKLLELEDQLSKERIKLGLLRRQHYEQEEAQEQRQQIVTTTTTTESSA